MSKDSHEAVSQQALDERLAETSVDDLERFAAVGDGTMMSPPFHNVFFNAFVNSPNFSKRLRSS